MTSNNRFLIGITAFASLTATGKLVDPDHRRVAQPFAGQYKKGCPIRWYGKDGPPRPSMKPLSQKKSQNSFTRNHPKIVIPTEAGAPSDGVVEGPAASAPRLVLLLVEHCHDGDAIHHTGSIEHPIATGGFTNQTFS